MSRLEELIQELCPEGVEYKKIEEVANYEQPSKYIVKRTKYDDSYVTPVLTAGQTFILGYTNETDGIFQASKDNPVIIFDDFTGAFKWVDFPFKVKSSAMKIITTKENNIPLRYLFHIMGYLGFKSDEHKRLWIRIYSQLQIPVPPLEVQREIVRILDSFTLLTAELTAELTARKKQYEYYRDELLKPKANIPMVRLDVQKRYSEVLDNFEKICNDLNIGLPAEIEARQKQYEFYRDALLTYAETGKIILTDKQTDEYNALIRLCQYVFGFVMLPLSEICNSISSGKAKTKDDIGKYPVYGSTGIIARTDNAIYNKMNILVARVGANAGYTHLAQGGYDVSDNTLIVDVKNEYSLKYIYYQLVNIGLNRYAKGGGQPLVTAGQIKEVVLPVPMKQEQDRIVDILDRFDSLCNDITTGLPAEIEARQKQYEFYRDKLLSFKQL